MSARRSASGFGVRPAASIFARTNRSIGVRAHFRSLTSGRAGRTGATNAQCCFHSAPCSIQRLRVSFCPSLSVLWLESGGIRRAGFGFGDLLVEEALLRLTRHDRRAVAPWRQRVFVKVESQVGLPRRRVRAVTEKAVVRENRADVALEIYARLCERLGRRAERARRPGPPRPGDTAAFRIYQSCQSTNLPMQRQNKNRPPKRITRSVCGRMPVMRPKFALPSVPFGFA